MSENSQNLNRCGCCEPPGHPTPEEIYNRPSLPNIRYRVGTYSSFRQAMIQAISKSPILRNIWTSRTSDDDYGLALFDMWAYLADILTFYQERIANEAFLQTALLRESVVRLAALLDYELAPGVAAVTHLAFTLEKDKQLDIPIGLRVQSVPAQDEKPQKFETFENIPAFASLNEISLWTTKPLILGPDVKHAALKGVTNNLKVGDSILVVGKDRVDHPESEDWEVRRLSEVQVDRQRNTTTIRWVEGLGKLPYVYPPATTTEYPKLFVFRREVSLFGYNAPDWRLLSDNLKKEDAAGTGIFPDWTGKRLPEDENHQNWIFLDNVHKTIQPNSWIALVTPKPVPGHDQGYVELYRVKESVETVQVNYTLTSKVTRLTTDTSQHIDYFPIQGTTVLVQSEQLELAEEPITLPLSGGSLILDGFYPDIQVGQRLILTGELADKSGERSVEVVQVFDIPPNPTKTNTVLNLTSPLSASYDIESVKLYGNVVKATHGETVTDEALGNGDASASFQSFRLQKSPVTFVPDPNARHGAANTLKLRVNGVLWHEAETLYGHGNTERIYTDRLDNDGVMTVQFGDGVTGARLFTGRANVVATYRQGLGIAGNVHANALTTLLDRPLGVKSVTNPDDARDGTDPETLEQARINAPNTVRTFDRIVSLRDFEDAAREFTSVGKARASWEWDGLEQAVHLTVAGVDGAQITDDTYKNLVNYLDARRDSNRKLIVNTFRKLPVQVESVITVDPDYVAKDVQASATKALSEYFAFANQEFGQPVHLSRIYDVLQDIEGVVMVDVNRLQFKNVSDRLTHGASARALQDHLRVFPSELAVIEDSVNDAIVRVS